MTISQDIPSSLKYQPIKIDDNNLEIMNPESRYDISTEILKLSHAISSLEDSFIQLNNTQKSNQATLDRIFDETKKILNDLDEKQSKIEQQHEDDYDRQKKIIDEQQAELQFYRHNSWWMRIIKKFLRPKIGILYHYSPKKILIPKYYNKTLPLESYPTISIVTPSYNQGNYLEKTIKSVLDQDYPRLEYIVQDGGSTDNTIDMIQPYLSKLKHWESIKDKGQSHALNLGFKHTTGEIMAYLNSDDLLLPGSLNYIAKFFNEHPDIDVVYGHRILIDHENGEIGRWILPKHDSAIMGWADYIPQETLFWRRRIWDKVGGKIDESFQFAMDWDLILRFIKENANFVRLPRFIGAFRVHDTQKTSARINTVGTKEMEKLRKRWHGKDVSQLDISTAIRPYLLRHLVHHKLYKLGILRY